MPRILSWVIAAISVGTRKVLTNLAKPRAILPDIVEKNYSFINIVQSPSTERDTQVGTMTEGNISGTDRNNYFIFHQVILKTRQRETKLFRFSRDTNTEQLKIKKTMSLPHGFVAIASMELFSLLPFA